ncbi:purine permease [Histoplasma capsulatum]|uniref:Purine permease n=1 Tax=Ajellomyces capsulatus TaxID=5037 RepID=A0A8A1MGB4_AJECA|nr:purine permease [Histoplasma capsulatum]
MSKEPDQIFPDVDRAKNGYLADKMHKALRTLTTRAAPFFGLEDRMPMVLGLILGLQHALAMLAGIITPPILMSGSSGAELPDNTAQYLVSTSLIVSGLLSAIQMTRFHIYKTPYYLGTGLISVVGTSFATIPVAMGAFAQMYETGYCPVDEQGNHLPCPHGYGALLATSCLCALLEIGLSFTSTRYLKRLFPPLVTGPTVLLIGIKLIESGLKNWAGGSGSCASRPPEGPFMLCPNNDAPHALPWGSGEFIGLGFLVFVTIILCERFGSPIMKSCAVVLGLLVGCIVAAATGYFDRADMDSAPSVSFIWVHTFRLEIYPPIILPLLAVYTVLMMEAIGDITATCDVSRLDVEGPVFDTRIQGGVLADGLNGLIAGLCTITPMSVFAQNNGVISLTRCANRKAVKFTRRNRFILSAALALGVGATLVPEWFSFVFTYRGNNKAKKGLIDAVELVMATGFVIAGFIALILNLALKEEEDEVDEKIIELPRSTSRSRRGKEVEAEGGKKVESSNHISHKLKDVEEGPVAKND